MFSLETSSSNRKKRFLGVFVAFQMHRTRFNLAERAKFLHVFSTGHKSVWINFKSNKTLYPESIFNYISNDTQHNLYLYFRGLGEIFIREVHVFGIRSLLTKPVSLLCQIFAWRQVSKAIILSYPKVSASFVQHLFGDFLRTTKGN